MGATSRVTPDRGLSLSADAWGWMPKLDGIYARVSTDRRGRIFSVLSRAGTPVREARDLLGMLAGAPDSVLHGELEARTEAGVRIAAGRGWRALHLFDCTRHGGADVTRSPFIDRYDLLRRDHDRMLEAGTTNPWLTDELGRAHHLTTGRYVKPVPRDHRRLPVVPLVRDGAALWASHVAQGGGEGLVAVKLNAPARARMAKRKIKQTDTIDCTIVSVDREAALLDYRGHMFAVSNRMAVRYQPGQVVEVKHDGWYEASVTPKFARIVRARTDLA